MITKPQDWPIFLFTDIQGSTRLWERYPEAFSVVLARHDDLLCQIVESHGGQVFKTVGDAVYAIFERASEALLAALAGQRALLAEPWIDCGMDDGFVLRVRFALHSGPAERRGNDYYLELATRAEPELTGPQQTVWLDRLGREHGNLRAALRHFQVYGPAEDMLRLASRLGPFWYTRGYLIEGQGWIESALAQAPSASAAERAHGLNRLAFLLRLQGDYAQAIEYYQAVLDLQRELGDPRQVARLLSHIGTAAIHQGRYEQAEALLRESMAVLEDLGDRRGVAVARSNLGLAALYSEDYDRARSLWETSMALFEEIEDEGGIAACSCNLGWATLAQGERAVAWVL